MSDATVWRPVVTAEEAKARLLRQAASSRLGMGPKPPPTRLERACSCCPALTYQQRLVGFVMCFAAGMVLSLTSDVTTTRCQRDPSQYCRYIDNIPFIATLVFFYVCTCLVRAFFLHFHR